MIPNSRSCADHDILTRIDRPDIDNLPDSWSISPQNKQKCHHRLCICVPDLQNCTQSLPTCVRFVQWIVSCLTMVLGHGCADPYRAFITFWLRNIVSSGMGAINTICTSEEWGWCWGYFQATSKVNFNLLLFSAVYKYKTQQAIPTSSSTVNGRTASLETLDLWTANLSCNISPKKQSHWLYLVTDFVVDILLCHYNLGRVCEHRLIKYQASYAGKMTNVRLSHCVCIHLVK